MSTNFLFSKSFLALIATLPSLATAAPSADVLAEIQANYDPRIEVRSEAKAWSLFSATTQKLEIFGMDPLDHSSRKVDVTEYFNGSDAERATAAAVIILPPTGGTNALDTGYADLLASRGFRALLIEHWAHDADTVNMELVSHDRSALRALVAVKHVVEYASQGKGKIGILGTSVGGLTSALALGEDSRIAAGALIVAGGRMSEIIAHSTEEGVTKLRKARFAKSGYKNEAEYEQALRAVLRYDTLDFANHSGKKAVWMSLGLADLTVPTKNQMELKALLNPSAENLVEYNANHLNAILGTYFMSRWAIADFFARELK